MVKSSVYSIDNLGHEWAMNMSSMYHQRQVKRKKNPKVANLPFGKCTFWKFALGKYEFGKIPLAF